MEEVVSLKAGQILSGSLFSEPMRVETIRQGGNDTWVVGLVGVQTERFRSVTLSSEQFKTPRVHGATCNYKGDDATRVPSWADTTAPVRKVPRQALRTPTMILPAGGLPETRDCREERTRLRWSTLPPVGDRTIQRKEGDGSSPMSRFPVTVLERV